MIVEELPRVMMVFVEVGGGDDIEDNGDDDDGDGEEEIEGDAT